MIALVEGTTGSLPLLLPLIAAAIAVWLLMPRVPERRSLRIAGAMLGAAALVGAGLTWMRPSGAVVHDVLFFLLSGIAVSSGVLMITSRNPVYAALWFALGTLSVCGLFLLRSAPFLAAATVIVYAGAIIVTFLFVLMLAQQSGLSVYDRQTARSFPAIAVTFVLLGGLLVALPASQSGGAAKAAAAAADAERPALAANPLSRAADGTPGTMRGLGRSLFGDYLYAVEVAGTLLLVSCIGAIAIAPRRSRGGL